jgi:hypothetical protein
MRVKRASIALAAVLSLAACGGGSPRYAPASRGPAGTCYYVVTPGECNDTSGLRPTVMPASWRATYADYYDSPDYYNNRVPSSYRSRYVSNVKTFERQNSNLIKSQASKANWRGSDGSTKTGSVGKSGGFTSGDSRTSKSGTKSGGFTNGGSRTSKSNSGSYSRSGSSSRSGGFSSGSSRTSSRSK